MIIRLIDEAVSSGARRGKACELIGVHTPCLERWKKNGIDRRQVIKKVPANKLSNSEEIQILEQLKSKEFRDLSPNQIVPLLADRGIYLASESTLFRILRRNNLLCHRGKARAPSPRKRPDPFIATGPNQVWSWDITYLKSPVRGQYYYLYLIMDIWSRKIVGFDVHDTESADLAAQLFLKTVNAEKIDPEKLVLHSDNGSPMRGETMVATLERLGVIASFSRPRVSDDNPYSEALFRTCKYRPEYPSKPFLSQSAALKWVQEFVVWYNGVHLHSGIRFVTPNERHDGTDTEKLRNRKKVYEEAKRENPNRWTGKTRNWEPLYEVKLNAPRQAQKDTKKKGSKLDLVTSQTELKAIAA